ncbi:DUF2029 domain-containing protein [Candidatus Daviesbacteria bacterium]|nr:DUF2029 domain-containing protein [Candidatus Daviesbacteria bacterium]
MKKIWIILTVAIALRIFLSFATLHPDIVSLMEGGKVLTRGHILDLYDYSSDKIVFNYPPSIYWYFGLLNFLFSSLGFLKLPYIIFDIAIATLLSKMAGPKKSMAAFALWLFNPVSIYATYMMGQFDIIPTFFSVLSIYLAFKTRLSWSAFALGMGIAFKLYPLFLVVPLILLGKGFWTKVKLVIFALIPYLVSVLPYIQSSSFRSQALFANQSSKSLYAAIPVSGGEAILLFPLFLLLFYLYIWNRQNSTMNLWKVFLIPLLLFFILTHYHPQWLIWVIPFLILGLVINNFQNLYLYVLILGSWFFSLFFFDSSLTLGMLAPLFPALREIPDIWTILGIGVDYNLARSILQTVFASASFYLIYTYFPKKENA